MTARFPASSPTRGAAAGTDLAAEAAGGTALAAPAVMKSRRVVASMLDSHAAGDGWGESTVGRDLAALSVHVVRPCPVGEREVWPVLIAALRRDFEHTVDSHEVLATARVVRIGVIDDTG